MHRRLQFVTFMIIYAYAEHVMWSAISEQGETPLMEENHDSI